MVRLKTHSLGVQGRGGIEGDGGGEVQGRGYSKSEVLITKIFRYLASLQ